MQAALGMRVRLGWGWERAPVLRAGVDQMNHSLLPGHLLEGASLPQTQHFQNSYSDSASAVAVWVRRPIPGAPSSAIVPGSSTAVFVVFHTFILCLFP